MSVTLYKIDGTEIEVGGGDTPEPTPTPSVIAVAAKAKKSHGVRSNIVQAHGYDPNYSGDVRWMESGLLFKRTKDRTSFTFTWKVEITGGATQIVMMCKGADSVSVTHEYSEGEQTYTDTFSNDAKLKSDYIRLYTVIATPTNTDNPTRIGTARTLKLASIPDGLELVGEYFERTPTLLTDTLTFDEAKTYPSMVSRWQGRRWIAMGDSITQGVSPWYHGVAGQMLQMTVANAGKGGTALVQWANSLLAGVNYSAYDLATIMHGVNDHDNSPNSPIGTLAAHGSTFDKSTYIGAYQYIIETILSNSPVTEIIILGSTTVSNDNTVNNVGAKMSDYRAAAKAVAEDYGLAYFDASTVITPANYQSLTSDGIHLNAAGHELLGTALAEWMVTI